MFEIPSREGLPIRGDIEASLTEPTGLVSFDTRFLSKWVLTVNGARLTALRAAPGAPLNRSCRMPIRAAQLPAA